MEKDNCKTRRETFKSYYLVRLILEVWRCYFISDTILTADGSTQSGNKAFVVTINLTHWGWDKIAAIFLTTFSNAFSSKENICILIKVSQKFVPEGPIDNTPGLVQIMAWHR